MSDHPGVRKGSVQLGRYGPDKALQDSVSGIETCPCTPQTTWTGTLLGKSRPNVLESWLTLLPVRHGP